jgi:hypothetical protein
MFVKKFKRKCSVRGCKNTANVYLISKRREMGGTIGICTECLKEATESIKAYTEPEKVVREDKPLFPHPELTVTTSSVAEEVKPEPTEVIVEEPTEDNPISVAEDSVTYKADTSATKSKPKSNNKSKR